MDGLSAVASGFAVVSIAIQLTDSLKKFADFIDSVREAPEDVESDLSELRMLSSMLEEIRLQQSSSSNANSSVETCLTNLQQNIISFAALANRYRPNISSQNSRIQRWSAIRTAFKSEKSNKYRELLSKEKLNLMLALQVFQ